MKKYKINFFIIDAFFWGIFKYLLLSYDKLLAKFEIIEWNS